MTSIKDLEELYSLAQYKEYSLGIDGEIDKFIDDVKKWKIHKQTRHTWKNCAEIEIWTTTWLLTNIEDKDNFRKVSIWKSIDDFFYEKTKKIVDFITENFFITFFILIPMFSFVICFLLEYFCWIK